MTLKFKKGFFCFQIVAIAVLYFLRNEWHVYLQLSYNILGESQENGPDGGGGELWNVARCAGEPWWRSWLQDGVGGGYVIIAPCSSNSVFEKKAAAKRDHFF